MTTVKLELTKYISKPLIGGLILGLYDKLMGDFTYTQTAYDVGILAMATIASQVATDVFMPNKLFSGQTVWSSIPKMLLNPLITCIVYEYLYDSIFRSTYPGLTLSRTPQANYITGFVISVMLNWVENPLVAFFTGSSVY